MDVYWRAAFKREWAFIGENMVCYKIRNRLLGQVYNFSLLICYLYSFIYCKSSVETLTTGFWQLMLNILCKDVHSQLWACQTVGTSNYQCSSIFTIQGNVNGVICRVITPKDKERYPSPLTKQNAHRLGVDVGSSHLKTRK